MDLYFEIEGTNIVLTNPQTLVADSARYIILHFDFKTTEWLDGEKTAYIGKHSVVLGKDNSCEMPILTKGSYNVGVGIAKSDGTVIYTNKASIRLSESIKPTQTLDVDTLSSYEQIMSRIDSVTAKDVPEKVSASIEEYFANNPELTNPKYDIGKGLKLVGDTLSVDTTDEVAYDNTKPITSSAVYTTIGNIQSILNSI